MTSLASSLNQICRRLRNYGNEEEWISIVRDAAELFCSEVGVFTFQGGTIKLRREHGLGLSEGLLFAASSAAAFQAAIESKEPVAALRTVREVTEILSSPESDARAHLFPIANSERVVAILFAGSSAPELDGLELIAGMAASVLERHANRSIDAQLEPQPVLSARPAAKIPIARIEKEPELHLKARRFSRLSVAQMQLARPEACRAGREQKNLYMFLQREIDAARVTYQKQFMTDPAMPDYLHRELVENAAEGDESRLGAEYPGKLD